jgi:hypothetical protein
MPGLDPRRGRRRAISTCLDEDCGWCSCSCNRFQMNAAAHDHVRPRTCVVRRAQVMGAVKLVKCNGWERIFLQRITQVSRACAYLVSIARLLCGGAGQWSQSSAGRRL